MKRLLTLLPLVLIALLQTSCGDWTSDPDEVDTDRIIGILDAIKEKFNNHDAVEEIMFYYSDDYLHDGDGLTMARVAWELRWIEYVEMDIVNIEIEFDGDKATASFELHFLGTGGEDIFLEPYDHGDISYLRKENGYWRVYGNQNPGEGANLYIDSSPQGARIYFDNSFMHQYTPATLHSAPVGEHVLRLYKAGWNELETTIDVSETLQLDYTLTTPGWPHPVFDIDSPDDNEHTSEATIQVDAIVRVQAQSGATSDFDGEYVIISVNGNETVVPTTGFIHAEVDLQPGENEVKLRATGAAGHTSETSAILVTRL